MLDRSLSSTTAYSYKPFSLGGSRFTAMLFSKPRNWSLSQLAHEDEAVRADFGAQLGHIYNDLNLGKAYAPSPIKFTDRIIHPDELTVAVSIGKHVLYRNPEKPADGVPLCSGEACFISPSSCPTTVMVGGDGRALVLHTGRDCLFDRHGLEHGKPAPDRKHPSVIYSALYWLGNPEAVKVKVLWSILPHLFVHDMKDEKYGAVNERMHYTIAHFWGQDSVPMRGSKFQLDLPKLIRDQCKSRGVPEVNIDLTHAYHPPSGTWLDGAKGTPRNLVVISRHS